MRLGVQWGRLGWAQARHLALTLTGACVRADAATAMCNNFWNRQARKITAHKTEPRYKLWLYEPYGASHTAAKV